MDPHHPLRVTLPNGVIAIGVTATRRASDQPLSAGRVPVVCMNCGAKGSIFRDDLAPECEPLADGQYPASCNTCAIKWLPSNRASRRRKR